MHPLVERLFANDPLALSRLMTLVENRADDVFEIMTQVQEHCGHAKTVGITGPPGAGKSTLADKLIGHLRKAQRRVGVVAIDPSSPFSGGAVMGDRIRMQDHAGDDQVFIRSLGTRGSLGGISRATREMVKLYDAAGVDEVIVETVGVGQTEFHIMGIAETTVVVLTPESGDTIQTMKAGILEIADIFVVNKADREGADRMAHELKAMLEIAQKGDWTIPVLLTQARDDLGVSELHAAIESHRDYLQGEGRAEERRRQVLIQETQEIILEELSKKVRALSHFQTGESRISNPYETALAVLEKVSL
jgi:LAO/AO transport system kinase